MLGRMADWVTITTGPLTVLSTFAAWFVRLDESSTGERPERLELLTVLMIVVVFVFLFLAQVRVIERLHEALHDTAAFFMSCVFGVLCLATFIALQSLLLATFVPATDSPLIQLGWLLPPSALWVVATAFVLGLLQSGEFRKR